ncbi:alpha-amylase family protein [Paenibacillus roseipurpureus]|uniref:Alpha-galactosidase n=1 Tax=Paenibacillus roseopurpureus TaxID=2918901 RepID=A0AA96LQP8_9BACL|nr:alpha-galactosidase [Paenibacillus sp. MBLB1832]WNR45434.1 alpha-galactosidase [Paenibacillus sp. MBLB1832]
MSQAKYWQGTYVQVEGDFLRVGNDFIERKWTFESGRPVSISIIDKQRKEEWLKPIDKKAMFQFPWLAEEVNPASIVVSTVIDHDFGISRPYLQTNVDMHFESVDKVIRMIVKIYPDSSFIRHDFAVFPLVKPEITSSGSDKSHDFLALIHCHSQRTSVVTEPTFQLDDNNKGQGITKQDYYEHLELKDLHCRWEAVAFRDRTDTNNNLVGHDSGLLYINELHGMRGNVLVLKKTIGAYGLMVIKEGPTPLGALQEEGVDFQFRGLKLSVEGTGVGGEDLAHQEEISSYGATIGVYDGTPFGSYQLLHDYHRNLREYKAERDSFIMSNTWGDRSKDGAINEAFIMNELEVAAELGVQIVQIDDGWEKGVTLNSVHASAVGGLWSHYWSGRGDFWHVHPERFPQGLSPVIELAKKLQIMLGLWYSPDSSNDYANWEKDIATLIQLYEDYGVRAFKLDGIEIGSKIGETRLLNIMRQVVRATGGRVDFNLDATAQKRLGYFGQTQYGSIFLENRYTDWRNYYPHWTLRNLWMLAPYLPTSRLQMEFLHVNRNQHLYGDDPFAPAAGGQIYAFALVAFTNPLAWMELSNLDDKQVEVLSAVIHAIKPHHPNILAGHVLPLGQEPCGTSWTGFQSITTNKSGYLLIVREQNDDEFYSIKLWGMEDSQSNMHEGLAAPSLKLTEIVRMDEKDVVMVNTEQRSFELQPCPNGNYSFTRPNPFTFAIYRYEK